MQFMLERGPVERGERGADRGERGRRRCHQTQFGSCHTHSHPANDFIQGVMKARVQVKRGKRRWRVMARRGAAYRSLLLLCSLRRLIQLLLQGHLKRLHFLPVYVRAWVCACLCVCVRACGRGREKEQGNKRSAHKDVWVCI